MFKKSVFIFRRDLRLDDNTALIAALNNSESVFPCFILDHRQINSHSYKSEKAFQLMGDSLKIFCLFGVIFKSLPTIFPKVIPPSYESDMSTLLKFKESPC